MTTLIMVRHAQAAPSGDLPPRDWPLTEEGRRQAEAVAPVLAEFGVEALWSSPYLRAVETLSPFARDRGLDIARDDDLRERELGAWIESADAVEAAIARTHADPDFRLEGGESARVSLARFDLALARLVAAHAGQTVAVGSHGGLLSYLIGRMWPGVPPPRFWRDIRNPHLFVFDARAGLRWIDERTFDGAPRLLPR